MYVRDGSKESGRQSGGSCTSQSADPARIGGGASRSSSRRYLFTSAFDSHFIDIGVTRAQLGQLVSIQLVWYSPLFQLSIYYPTQQLLCGPPARVQSRASISGLVRSCCSARMHLPPPVTIWLKSESAASDLPLVLESPLASLNVFGSAGLVLELAGWIEKASREQLTAARVAGGTSHSLLCCISSHSILHIYRQSPASRNPSHTRGGLTVSIQYLASTLLLPLSPHRVTTLVVSDIRNSR